MIQNNQKQNIELCFPENNEEEFIKVAEKLNKRSLCFVYRFKESNKNYLSNISSLQKSTKIHLTLGILAQKKDIQKAKKSCSFVMTESSEDDQIVLETLSPNLIFNLEAQPNKDRFNFRSSGLNHILCAIAKEKSITIGFSFSEILNSKNRSLLFGRLSQNLRLCKKYKVRINFASFAKQPYELRSDKDLESFEAFLNR